MPVTSGVEAARSVPPDDAVYQLIVPGPDNDATISEIVDPLHRFWLAAAEGAAGVPF